MIGELPKTLKVNGTEWIIHSDFRTALLIFQAFNDPDLSTQEKSIVMLSCLFEDFESMEYSDYQEAQEQASRYLDGGKEYHSGNSKHGKDKKLMDWEQDEQMIFSAVNKVAGFEVRTKEYLHWWTFLGFFNEIGECLFSTVLAIRQKKAKGKKLEKYEQDFYRDNKELIDLKQKYTAEEQAEIDYWNELLG